MRLALAKRMKCSPYGLVSQVTPGMNLEGYTENKKRASKAQHWIYGIREG